MVVIDGIKYAESVSEMVDSLFNDGEGTLPLLPVVLKRELQKAAAAYKVPEEEQKKLDFLRAVDGCFTGRIKIH